MSARVGLRYNCPQSDGQYSFLSTALSLSRQDAFHGGATFSMAKQTQTAQRIQYLLVVAAGGHLYAETSIHKELLWIEYLSCWMKDIFNLEFLKGWNGERE